MLIELCKRGFKHPITQFCYYRCPRDLKWLFLNQWTSDYEFDFLTRQAENFKNWNKKNRKSILKKEIEIFKQEFEIDNKKKIEKSRLSCLSSCLKELQTDIFFKGEDIRETEKSNSPPWFTDAIIEILTGQLQRLIRKRKRIQAKITIIKYPQVLENGEFKNSITARNIEQVKEYPLLELIDTPLQKIGIKKYRTSSPWRQDKNPSLIVYEDSNSFCDFGDNTAGDIIDFVRKINNCSFLEAVKYLLKLIKR